LTHIHPLLVVLPCRNVLAQEERHLIPARSIGQKGCRADLLFIEDLVGSDLTGRAQLENHWDEGKVLVLDDTHIFPLSRRVGN